MAISEKVELLGKHCYAGKNIPDVLTVKSIPTASELEYVAAEDFDETMLSEILPKAVEEKIDFNQLLEIDYQWLLRCLRIVNYGPYHTTNAIYCSKCGRVNGEYRVDLQSVPCKPLPDNFNGEVVISRNEFLDYKQDIKLRMLTIREVLNCEKDSQFVDKSGKTNHSLARLCYMIKSMGTDTTLTPIEVRLKLLNDFSAADYAILKDLERQCTDYGLRAGGSCSCPKCGQEGATFIALVDDRYFRPTLGDLRAWKTDRDKRKVEDAARNKTTNVRKHS